MDEIIKKYSELNSIKLRKALIEFEMMLENEKDGRFGVISKERNDTYGRVGCRHCGGTVRGHISRTCPNCGNELLNSKL